MKLTVLEDKDIDFASEGDFILVQDNNSSPMLRKIIKVGGKYHTVTLSTDAVSRAFFSVSDLMSYLNKSWDKVTIVKNHQIKVTIDLTKGSYLICH